MKLLRMVLTVTVMLIAVTGLLLADEPDNLIGHWAFDGELIDSVGTVDGVFYDSLGVQTATYEEGKYGQAVVLDSLTHQCVVLGDSNDLNFGTDQDFSIAIWVKTTGWMKDAAIISNKDWDSGSNTGYVIAGQGGGKGAWQWNYAANRTRQDFDAEAPELSDGEWHHICVTHDRDGVAKCYFDGELQAAKDISEITGSINSGYPTVIGADGAKSEFWRYWFNGLVDDLKIYGDILTDKEVASLAELKVIPELIGYWPFDGDLKDYAGEADGFFNGYELTYSDGMSGSALSLDGMSDCVVLGDTINLNFGEELDFSVAFWVKSNGWDGDPCIIGNKDWGSGSNTGWLIAGHGGGEGPYQWNYSGSVGGRSDYDPSNQVISDGEWHHITVTHDRDSVAIFYFDGIAQDTVDISGCNGFIYDGYPVVVGQDGTQEYEDWFKGDIDELRIYNYVIDQEQVKELSEKTELPEMVAHYTFDETLLDSIGDADAVFYDQFGSTSVKYVDGRYGQAIDLNQSSIRFHSLVLGDEEDFNFGYSQDFTVALWIKTTGWDGDACLIGNKDWGSGSAKGWLIAGEGGGEGGWQWNYAADGSRQDFDPEGLNLSNGEWHHICISHDRDGMASFYYDGKQIGEKDISAIAGTVTSGYPVVIGNDGTQGYDDYFDGYVDDVRIYNHTLTSKQVAVLAENPEIVSITDVPKDQGGWVYVRFNSAVLDDGNKGDISYYIQRNDDGIWTSLSSAPATGDSVYQVAVKTIVDSSAEESGITEFRLVTTMTEGTWASDAFEGYSIDNILPAVPQNLAAVKEDNGVKLSWSANSDEDFKYYAIYRGTTADFDASAMDPVLTTTEISVVDATIEAGTTYYYRITAFDEADNESNFSASVAMGTVGIDDESGTPTSFALHQNYPNPFNPETTIKFDLPEQSFVSIKVFNLRGEIVANLLNTNKQAGYHSVIWNASNVASGTYFYQIRTDGNTALKKMILIK